MTKQATMTDAERVTETLAALEELAAAERRIWSVVPCVAASDPEAAEDMAKTARRISKLRDVVQRTLEIPVGARAASLGKKGRA